MPLLQQDYIEGYNIIHLYFFYRALKYIKMVGISVFFFSSLKFQCGDPTAQPASMINIARVNESYSPKKSMNCGPAVLKKVKERDDISVSPSASV